MLWVSSPQIPSVRPKFKGIASKKITQTSEASQGDAECVGRASAVTWRMVPLVPAESDVI